MNYNLPLDPFTIATPPQRVSADGSAGISANLGRLFLEPQQHIAGASGRALLVPAEFKKHEKKWKRDTRYTSSLMDKYLHQSYARIIGMGQPAVSLILRSLEQQPDDWFYALRAITSANPVHSTHAGDMQKMTRAWLNWGRRRGLCA